MKVIEPGEVTLLSSTVPEDDAPRWSASTTYAKDAKVIYEKRVYRSLKDSNSGKQPDKNKDGTEAWWVDTGAVNRWKMFDEAVSTQTVVTGEGEVSLEVSVFAHLTSAVALANVDGRSVEISLTREGKTEPYYTRTYALRRPKKGWWRWYFEPRTYRNTPSFLDIPTCRAGTLQVVLRGVNRVAVGHMVFGRQWYIGQTQYGAQAQIQDWSIYDTDDFGNTTIVPRRDANIFQGDLYLHPSTADEIMGLMRRLKKKNTFWIGDNRDATEGGHESLSLFGFAKDVSFGFEGPNQNNLSLLLNGIA